MMGKTRSFQEAMAITLFEDKRLLKESMNKEQNKEGGIMEENKIRKRRVVVGLVKAVQIKQCDTLYLIDVLKGKQNEMEERQMEENKIKEAQEGMKEEQGNTVDLKYLRSRVELADSSGYFADPSGYFRLDCQRDHLRLSTMLKMIHIEIEPTEITEEQLGRQLFISEEQLGRQLFWDPFEEKMGIRSILFRGGQSWRKQFFRKGRNKREQWKSEKVRKSVEIWGGGKRAICADCHLEPRPGQVDNLLGVHAECRPKCPFVVNAKKRNADQANDVVTQTVPPCEQSVDIYNRRQMEGTSRQPTTGERLSTLRNRNLCQICKTLPRRIMFTPCNHFYSCKTCAEEAEECMRCNTRIDNKIDIYRS